MGVRITETLNTPKRVVVVVKYSEQESVRGTMKRGNSRNIEK
jgi:hypothetical protein